jgi:hypothetical protein
VRHYLKKIGGVAQGVGPEFKHQYKNKVENNYAHKYVSNAWRIQHTKGHIFLKPVREECLDNKVFALTLKIGWNQAW